MMNNLERIRLYVILGDGRRTMGLDVVDDVGRDVVCTQGPLRLQGP